MNNEIGEFGKMLKRNEEREIQRQSFDIAIPSKEEPHPLSWEELEALEIEPPSWRIDKILPNIGIVIFAAMSGTGKTWLLMEMAKAITTGTDYLGKFKTEIGNVLYLDAEGHLSEMKRRGKQLGFESSEGKLFILSKILNFNDVMEDDIDWLAKFIKDNKICAVFIDTFRGVAGGLKEEKAEEIRMFFNRFKVMLEIGIVFIFAEHLRKRGMFESKTPQQEQVFSSMDKVNSADVLLLAKSERTADNSGDEIHIYQAKNKFGQKEKPISVLMRDELDEQGNTKTILEFGGDVSEPELKIEEAKKIILEILPGGGKTTKQIIEITSRQVGEKNTRTALKQLATEGTIKEKRQGKEKYYWIGDENRSETPSLTEEDKLFDSS
jgi:hypothetical protein